jgi:hypothetical protein
MMYIVVILIGALLIAYFGGRWLLRELRELGSILRRLMTLATGGQTADNLVQETQTACRTHGLDVPDLVAVPSHAQGLYDTLRKQVLGRVPQPGLPAAVGFALAVDVDHGTLYLRCIAAPEGEAATERSDFVRFDDIGDIRSVPSEQNPWLGSHARAALEIQRTNGTPDFQLPIDPAWGLDPDDFVEHVRAMVRDHRRPAGGAVILR